MNLRLIHIAPELPPTVGGVADYTALLSRRLVEVTDGAVEPVLVHAGTQSTDTIQVDFPVVNLGGQCSPLALSQAIREHQKGRGHPVVLLEYANYGYAARGIPLWLLRGLRRACGQGGVPLVAMIHELYATGPPWSGAFWYSVPQRFAAAGLARLAQQVITNRHSAATWLARYRGGRPDVHVQPVFSNVGEPTELPPFQHRSRTAVVFGGGGKKQRIYRDNPNVLQYLTERRDFESILDVGPSDNLSKVNEDWLTYCGILPAETISDTLSEASLGIISYPATRLSKSGGAAAFASHGVPFVLLDEDEGGNASPYVEGTHFWRWSTLSEKPHLLSEKRREEMSYAIRTMYMEHMHSRSAARRFAQILEKTVSSVSKTTS